MMQDRTDTLATANDAIPRASPKQLDMIQLVKIKAISAREYQYEDGGMKMLDD